MAEYLAVTPLVLAMVVAVAGQILLAASGALACVAAARDAALAGAAGRDPQAAAHLVAPAWHPRVRSAVPVSAGGVRGVQVVLDVQVPLLPAPFRPGPSLAISCTAAAPLGPWVGEEDGP